MKTSEKGRQLIKEFEGEILKVYLDPIGLPTLGVGHLLTQAEKAKYPVGTVISKELSDEFLQKDLERFEKLVSELAPLATQNQFDAMVSLAFNIGEGKFNPRTKTYNGFRGSSVLRYHNRKDHPAAADSFLLWNKAGGKVIKGLIRRRKAEKELYLTE